MQHPRHRHRCQSRSQSESRHRAPTTGSRTDRAAAPAVRARAQALGVELGDLRGTGPDGRVTHGDLDARLRHAPGAAAAPAAGAPPDRRTPSNDVKVVGLRRNIAERMAASKRRIPHFTYVEEIDVTDLERLRQELNLSRTEAQPKLSLLPFLMRAVVQAVADAPGDERPLRRRGGRRAPPRRRAPRHRRADRPGG